MPDLETWASGLTAGMENHWMSLLNKFHSKKPEITSNEFTEATNFTNKSTAHKLQKSPCLSILQTPLDFLIQLQESIKMMLHYFKTGLDHLM